MKVMLLVLSALLCLTQAAKLDGLAGIGRQIQGYNYEPPAQPSGLYELPGPPPPPIIPSRRTTPRRTTPRRTTTTTTTTTTPPPPPPGLYETPEFNRDADAANRFSNFVSLGGPLETPKPLREEVKPATAPTPPGFMNKMGGVYMPYDIAYGVQDAESGNVFSHQESSQGDDVRGEYRVLLPDGRTQVVTFFADPVNGYTADVTYV